MSWTDSQLVKIDNERIRESIKRALDTFWERDSYLLEHDVNEVTITHKLGCYLQNNFEDFDVDNEYNRDLDDPKRFPSGTIKPDIIVHKRGTNEHNFLAIEVKKSNNPGTNEDLTKIKKYIFGSLRYDYALYMEFDIGLGIGYENFVTQIQFLKRSPQ